MPTFLLHGFRWPRQLIRIHIILQNLEDAAAEWLMAPKTTATMLKNFQELYPECMQHLPRLRLIEQYDPADLSASAASQPFAYIADVVEEVRLGVEIEEVRGRGLNNDQWTALMELRDKLAPDEKVGWFIVVCGDEERLAPPAQQDATAATAAAAAGNSHSVTSSSARGSDSGDGYSSTNGNEQLQQRQQQQQQSQQQQPQPAASDQSTQEPRGFKKLFGSARLGRRKSRSRIDTTSSPSNNSNNNKSKSRGRSIPPSRDEAKPVVPSQPPSLPNPV